MTTYTTTRAERETVIQFDEADNIVNYYTASPKRIKKLDQRVKDYDFKKNNRETRKSS